MPPTTRTRTAFITGISDGIGKAMCRELLAEGYRVYGCSRSAPDGLTEDDIVVFQSVDFRRLDLIGPSLDRLFAQDGLPEFDFVFLNAGLFGEGPRRAAETSLADFQHVLTVNLIANKVVLDYLLGRRAKIDVCMFSASIAGVRARAGNLSYAVSKAGLNALAAIYAQENPDIFFAVIGLCNIRTKLSLGALDSPYIADFPELVKLKERVATPGYMDTVEERAKDIHRLLTTDLKTRVRSGEFVEMRDLKKAMCEA
jgi:NAD(P)-dependent dehydrogenase (short-subunit alcohol dehydrogenase family)